jgi:hypothetical protein
MQPMMYWVPSMNGTTIQSVSGDLDTIGQLQLRMRGSRESQDTHGGVVPH